jgi:hypothetical protein
MNSLGKRFRFARCSLPGHVLRIVLASPLRGKSQALSNYSAAPGSVLAGSALFCASARLIDAPFCKPSAGAELKEEGVPPFFGQSGALYFNRRCATTPLTNILGNRILCTEYGVPREKLQWCLHVTLKPPRTGDQRKVGFPRVCLCWGIRLNYTPRVNRFDAPLMQNVTDLRIHDQFSNCSHHTPERKSWRIAYSL